VAGDRRHLRRRQLRKRTHGSHLRHNCPVPEYVGVGIADLLLDGQNPRHATVSGQRDILAALLRDGGNKLVNLAKDIAKYGLNPLAVPLVMKSSGGRYTVMEGNRRTAVLKLLLNPDLAAGHKVEQEFRKLAATVALPDEIQCTIVDSREEARHWLELQHTGERQGAGVVPWSAEQTQRFKGERGNHAERGLAFADTVASCYPDNKQLQTDLTAVRRDRITTLGRLVSDPDVRKALGFAFEDGRLLTHYPPAAMERLIARMLADLAGPITVTDLKVKRQRQEYLSKLATDLPDRALYRSGAEPLVRPPRPKERPKPAPPRRTATPPTRIFDGVNLANLSPRIAAILRELQQLNVDQVPNACAILTRVVIELAVSDVYDQKGWTHAQFRDAVKRCLTTIDPKQASPEYQAVRTGLQDGTSMFAVRTMHQFVHNQHFHAVPMEVRSIAANWAPFLIALDSLV